MDWFEQVFYYNSSLAFKAKQVQQANRDALIEEQGEDSDIEDLLRYSPTNPYGASLLTATGRRRTGDDEPAWDEETEEADEERTFVVGGVQIARATFFDKEDSQALRYEKTAISSITGSNWVKYQVDTLRIGGFLDGDVPQYIYDEWIAPVVQKEGLVEVTTGSGVTPAEGSEGTIFFIPDEEDSEENIPYFACGLTSYGGEAYGYFRKEFLLPLGGDKAVYIDCWDYKSVTNAWYTVWEINGEPAADEIYFDGETIVTGAAPIPMDEPENEYGVKFYPEQGIYSRGLNTQGIKCVLIDGGEAREIGAPAGLYDRIRNLQGPHKVATRSLERSRGGPDFALFRTIFYHGKYRDVQWESVLNSDFQPRALCGLFSGFEIVRDTRISESRAVVLGESSYYFERDAQRYAANILGNNAQVTYSTYPIDLDGPFQESPNQIEWDFIINANGTFLTPDAVGSPSFPQLGFGILDTGTPGWYYWLLDRLPPTTISEIVDGEDFGTFDYYSAVAEYIASYYQAPSYTFFVSDWPEGEDGQPEPGIFDADRFLQDNEIIPFKSTDGKTASITVRYSTPAGFDDEDVSVWLFNDWQDPQRCQQLAEQLGFSNV